MASRLPAAGVFMLAALAFLPLPTRPAAAQNPTVTNAVPESAALTLHAKISAIDVQKRTLTLTSASGEQVTVVAGPAVRLDMLKVGDRVDARYYRSVGFLVKGPEAGNAAPVSDDEVARIVAQPMQAPGGIGVQVARVSGTVVGLDLAENKIDLVDPSGGGVRSFIVTDPARIPMLRSLKVGDTITVVVSQALAVSIVPAPKSWF